MQEIKREERLLKVMAIVNEWLKFAESKNAMLIAFNGASIYGIAKALELGVIKNNPFFFTYGWIMIFFFVVSAVFCLLSFVPKIKIVSSDLYRESNSHNSLFFEHLKTRTPLQIMQNVCETKDEDFTAFETDIAGQIKQNSQIASRKLSWFTIAIWITVFTYVTPVFGGLFWAINRQYYNGSSQ